MNELKMDLIPLRVLIVEDSPSDADLIMLRLKNDGFLLDWKRVETETDYLASLETGYDLILSDWALPQFSGLRALQLMRERGMDTPFIIISGSIGEDAAVEALRQGAYDYLLKDRSKRLGPAVRNALEQKRLHDERNQVEEALKREQYLMRTLMDTVPDSIYFKDAKSRFIRINPSQARKLGVKNLEQVIGKSDFDFFGPDHAQAAYNDEQGIILTGQPLINKEELETFPGRRSEWVSTTKMPLYDLKGEIVGTFGISREISERKKAEEALRKSAQDLKTAYDATLQGWSSALEMREHETAGHSQRVVQLTLDLAQILGLGQDELVHIRRGALLHDIGKMGIPDSILLKPGPLNDDEWQLMRQHPVYAYNLLSKIPYLFPALDIPLYHHERWDGSGYPHGLKEKDIPFAARIFAVVDVWDALSHTRPYHPAWMKEAVIQYVKDQAGKQFDPQVVAAFLRLMDPLKGHHFLR